MVLSPRPSLFLSPSQAFPQAGCAAPRPSRDTRAPTRTRLCCVTPTGRTLPPHAQKPRLPPSPTNRQSQPRPSWVLGGAPAPPLCRRAGGRANVSRRPPAGSSRKAAPPPFDESDSGYLRAVTPQSRPGEGWRPPLAHRPSPQASETRRQGDPRLLGPRPARAGSPRPLPLPQRLSSHLVSAAAVRGSPPHPPSLVPGKRNLRPVSRETETRAVMATTVLSGGRTPTHSTAVSTRAPGKDGRRA